MNRMMKLFVVVAALTCGVMNAWTDFEHPPSVHALTAESIYTYTGTPSAETTVITGTASKSLHVRSLDIGTVSTSSIWVFKDGTGGTTLMNLYVVGGTPRTVTNVLGNNGLACTQNVLTATPSSAITVALNARCTNE